MFFYLLMFEEVLDKLEELRVILYHSGLIQQTTNWWCVFLEKQEIKIFQ